MGTNRTKLVVGVAGVALSLVLAGCSGSQPEPTATPTPSAPPADTPAPSPSYDPAAGAEGNHAFFDSIGQQVFAADAAAGGRAYVDALIGAGFDKSRMELTPDVTTADLPADSIQFSVRFDDGCIVGQGGQKTGFLSQVRPVLGSGTCLLGNTIPVD